MTSQLRNALAIAGIAIAAQATAQVTFYEREGFSGDSFSSEKRLGDFGRYGFNGRAWSAVVQGDRREVCDDLRFRGRCVVLRPGEYPTAYSMSLERGIASARTVGSGENIANNRYAPAPLANNDYRRRGNERLFEADVTSVHAVVGPPEQRCWIEREQVPQERGKANVPGAIAGALIGGILGHQVGGGRGKDIATVGGVVAGAAVGSNVGRNNVPATTRDVQHCASTPSQAKPEFWDVTYNFRGREHSIQLTSPPGATVTVNEQGEPRE